MKGDKGDKGDTGAQGIQGEKGDKGDAGADGRDGTDGVNGLTPYIGANFNWWIGDTDTGISALGIQGEKGDKGDAGADGRDGADGRGIESAEIVNGELILHYTDGTSDNLGKITGTSDDASPTEWFNFRAIRPNALLISIKDGFQNLPQKLIIPSEYAGIPVTGIASEGFRDCPYLQEVYIPASITGIGEMAFAGCTKLETVSFSEGLLSLGSNMFRGCTRLTYLEIPATVTSIGIYFLGSAPPAPVSKLVFKETAGWTYDIDRTYPIAQETVSDSILMARLLKGEATYKTDHLNINTLKRTAD